tara:strand:+ start:391 stop:741 length:351 start_codon:yes stop_codon:yes gene_type:complete
MKADPPLANGDITKKPWKTYTSSILNDKGEVTKPVVKPVEKFKVANKKFKEAHKKHETEVAKKNVSILDIGITDKPGQGNLSVNVFSYNPEKKPAEKLYKDLAKKFTKSTKKLNKK